MPTRCINRSLRRRQSASRSKPMMETLEPRQLLSAAVADAQPYLGNILHLAPALATGPLAGATPSNTEVTSNAVEESAVYGSTITLTATVSDETATGAVTFFDGTTSLGTGTVGVGGTWTLDVATLHAGAHSITAVYGGDETFDPSTSSIYTLTITAKPLTVTGITAANKTYDRLTTATLTTTNADLVGVLQDDIANVTLVKTNASGNFADASAATGSTVIVSGLTISGSAAGDYSLTQPTTTADITPIALTVTGITAGNKTYDRLTTATLTTTSASLVGVLAGDTANVTLVKTNATGNFADANVGNGKTVTITGLTLSGSAAGNYTVTNPSATANVSALTITVSGVTANKTYDGTTTATLNLTNAVLNTVIAGDTQNVTLTAANATASFASAGVGNGKTVTLSGLALTGSAAANYILTQPSITANIAAKALTVTGITAANKVYDHLTTATLTTTGATLVGVVAGDAANVTLVKTNASGNFADANVGNGKTVTLSGLTISGSAAANYTITQPTTTANITPKTLTLTGVTAANKVYNGSAAATLTIGTLGLTGVITADLANVSAVNGGAAGAFSSANVGNGKTVTITGVTLGGDAASNYTLAATTTANITPKTITVSGITGNNKVYDGSTAATFSIANAIVSGVLASDNANVTLTGTTGAFANANAGTAKAITPTGLTLSGSAAGNYTLTQPAITANITPKGLTITGIKAANKVYDHTTTATLTTSSAAISGLVAGDSNKVTLVKTNATGNFADANVGNGKIVTVTGLSLSGTAAGNYTITNATASANITPKTITLTGMTGVNKVYDGTTAADLNDTNASLNGVISADVVNIGIDDATGTFASASVGSNIKVTVNATLSGSAAANYLVVPASTSANITPKTLTVSGITADKVYNGSNAAGTVDTSGAVLTGVITADIGKLTVGKGSAKTGVFSSANAGATANATLSGLTLTGTVAKNYTLTAPVITAHITPKAITVSGVTGNNKTYDGTTTASLTTTSTTFTGLIAADKNNVTLSATNATANFASANVGTHIAITIQGLGLSGSAAGNYTLTQPSAFGNITPKALTVTGITAGNKTYDGTTSATVDTDDEALVGVVAGDSGHVFLIDDAVTGAFTNKNAGNAKAVAIGGLTIAGSAASNYTLTQPSATANITAKALTISGTTAGNKVYDGTTTASPVTTNSVLVGVVAGDGNLVSLVKTGVTGAFGNANVGNGKTVTLAGFTLNGSASGNYTLTQPTTTANITPKTITIAAILADKEYDGTVAAEINIGDANLQGVLEIDSEDVFFDADNAVVGDFDNANAGTHSLAITGITILGDASGNYTLAQPTITATITPKALTVSGVLTSDKTYDNTTAATVDAGEASLQGVVDGDEEAVTLVTSGVSGTFSDKNVGEDKEVTITGLSLSGSGAGNYTITQPASSASITPKALTASGITVSNKVYDGTDEADVDTTSASFAGIFASDLAHVSIDGAIGTFASANAGTGQTVTVDVVLEGSAADNYVVTPVTLTADITPHTVTAINLSTDKQYDGTADVILDLEGQHLSGIVEGDSLSLVVNQATYADANVGADKAITLDLELSGESAGNYTLVVPTLTGTISKRTLLVTGITAQDKDFDGNTAATIDTSGALLVGVVESELANVSLDTTNAVGTFDDAQPGESKIVTITGATLTGSAASHYTLEDPTTLASILLIP